MEAVAEIVTQSRSFDFNFHELMTLQIERPTEIIAGLICERQNVLLMGRFGVGKTMLGLQMSLALATGRDFLGRKTNKPYRTAIIDCENDLGDIKDRVKRQHKAMGFTPEEEAHLNSNWRCASAADPESELYGTSLDKGDFKALKAFVQKHSPEILVIDNLGWIVSRGDLKESDEAKEFFRCLAALRSETSSLQDGSILVMHHMTKPGEHSPTEDVSLLTAPYMWLSRARGTGRLLDFAQARLGIALENAGPQQYYVVNGVNRSTSMAPLILQFNQDTLCFEKHDDQELRFNKVFANRPRGRQVYSALPNLFTWTDAEQLIDPSNGKPFNKDTINNTRIVCIEEGFLKYDGEKFYTKLFKPPIEQTRQT